MSITDKAKYILHNIRIKLYPNFLPKAKGKYIARTANERTHSVEDVCNILKTRGGFTGNVKKLVEHIEMYYGEVAYQLCDGFAVNNGYYTVYPNIGGTFNSVDDECNDEAHPIDFRFSMREKLRELIEHINVEMAGIADVAGRVSSFRDLEEAAGDHIFVPGHMFVIHGDKIKLAGDAPCVGVYFVPEDDPSKAIKVERIGENNPSKITGIAPDSRYTRHRIEVRTQFTGSSKILLKTPRVITSEFIIEKA